jgi:hypothetical protein
MIDPESRRVLDLARAARTPSEANKAAVERRLATALGVWAGASAATAAAASSSTLGASKLGASKLAAAGALKWWLGGVALLCAGATYVALSAAPARHDAGVVQKRVPAAAIETASAQPAPAVAKRAPIPAEQTPAPEARSARPVPARALARNERPRAAADTAKAGELDLLHRAQAAWRAGQPRNALGLLDQHRARFPRSALRVERDALRALTLCELGRGSEARTLARQVLAREPRSPLRAALEQSCAL